MCDYPWASPTAATSVALIADCCPAPFPVDPPGLRVRLVLPARLAVAPRLPFLRFAFVALQPPGFRVLTFFRKFPVEPPSVMLEKSHCYPQVLRSASKWPPHPSDG